MAEFNRLVLRAGAADAVSDVIDTTRMDNLLVHVTLTVSAATLVGTLAIGTGLVVDSGPAIVSATTPVAVSALPANITVSSGVLTFASPAAATHNIVLRLPNPGPFTLITYDYTSGGGTVDMLVNAYGWKF